MMLAVTSKIHTIWAIDLPYPSPSYISSVCGEKDRCLGGRCKFQIFELIFKSLLITKNLQLQFCLLEEALPSDICQVLIDEAINIPQSCAQSSVHDSVCWVEIIYQ